MAILCGSILCTDAAQHVAITRTGVEFPFCDEHWQQIHHQLQPAGVVIDLSAGLCDALAAFHA